MRQYKKFINSGVLRGDDHQTRIIQKLQDLHDELLNYDPPIIPYSSSENSIVSLLDPFCPRILNIFNPSSFPASLIVTLLYPYPLQNLLRKVSIFMATLEPEKLCLWIYFTRPCPRRLNVNDVFISTPL